MNATSYEVAREMLLCIIRVEIDRLCIRIGEQEILLGLKNRNMSEETLLGSLQMLSVLLYQRYGKKVIILTDEYDVPLDKAFQNG